MRNPSPKRVGWRRGLVLLADCLRLAASSGLRAALPPESAAQFRGPPFSFRCWQPWQAPHPGPGFRTAAGLLSPSTSPPRPALALLHPGSLKAPSVSAGKTLFASFTLRPWCPDGD